MECPRCKNDQVGPDGVCLACHYKVVKTGTIRDRESIKNKSTDPLQKSRQFPEVNTVPSSSQDELPQWRLELSQRLNALKKNEGKTANIRKPQSGNRSPEYPVISAKINAQPASPSPEHAGTIKVKKQIPQAESPSRISRPAAPQQKKFTSLGANLYTAGGKSASSDRKDVQKLIDSAVAQKSALHKVETPIFRPETPVENENKLILLSRTLSGLIDLIVVVLCTGIFIISADYFSGIVVLDKASIVEYAGLLLLVYFFYSIYFLATSGQTVGMMITDLRITGIEGSRPSIGQLFSRCLGYLLSVLLFGVGLFWSLFDRQNMCFHDRFSNTSITRIQAIFR